MLKIDAQISYPMSKVLNVRYCHASDDSKRAARQIELPLLLSLKQLVCQ